jgi:hypothetical protein
MWRRRVRRKSSCSSKDKSEVKGNVQKSAPTNLLQKCITNINLYSVTANQGRRHRNVPLWLPAGTWFCHVQSVCIPSFWNGSHTTIQTTCIIGQAKFDSVQLIQNLSIVCKTLRPATWIKSVIFCIKFIFTTLILS